MHPFPLIGSSKVSNQERSLPLASLSLPAHVTTWITLYHSSPADTSRSCSNFLQAPPPSATHSPVTPPLSDTPPVLHGQDQVLPIHHRCFWLIKTSAWTLVAMAVVFIYLSFRTAPTSKALVTLQETAPGASFAPQKAPLGEENQILNE